MERPAGVTVIGVLEILSAACCALLGILFLFGGAFFMTLMQRSGGTTSPGAGAMVAGGFAFVGIICFAIAALDVIVSIGMFKLREWARITTIVLCSIGVVLGLLGFLRPTPMAGAFLAGLFMRLVGLAINALIIWYLLQANVKQAFTSA